MALRVYAVIGSAVWSFEKNKYYELLEAIAGGKPVRYSDYGEVLGEYKGDITYIDRFSAREQLNRA